MKAFQYIYKRLLCYTVQVQLQTSPPPSVFHHDGMMHRSLVGTDSHPAAVTNVTLLSCLYFSLKEEAAECVEQKAARSDSTQCRQV